MVVSTDEATEVANANQFFNLVLECFVFLCGVAVVSMIATIFSHVGIWGSGRLAWWWYVVGLQGFVKETGSRDISGCVSGEAGFSGLSGSRVKPGRLCRGGWCRGCIVVTEFLYGEFASLPCGCSPRNGASIHAWRRVGGGRRCWRRSRV